MTVIECICTKCGKPFIWAVVVDAEECWFKFVECPHCKSQEVGLWHPPVKFASSGRGIKEKSDEIPRLPLVLDDDDIKRDLTPIIMDNMVIKHRRKYGNLPAYIGVSREVFQKYQFDLLDPRNEGGNRFLRGEFKIPMKVVD